jgi:hypothetical protein
VEKEGGEVGVAKGPEQEKAERRQGKEGKRDEGRGSA